MIRRLCFRVGLLVLFMGCLTRTSIPMATGKDEDVTRSVKTDTMEIALTFDDGPHPYLTERILEILERYNVKATFFMVGVNIENYPQAARAVLAAGHEVGNHTYSHHHMNGMSENACIDELNRCEDALEELCEYRPHLFRPPEGALNDGIKHSTVVNDYSLILWSLDTRDWETKNAEQIAQTVLDSICSGDIVLMHDFIGHNSKTPEALEILLPELLSRGFHPVTVSRLLEGA